MRPPAAVRLNRTDCPSGIPGADRAFVSAKQHQHACRFGCRVKNPVINTTRWQGNDGDRQQPAVWLAGSFNAILNGENHEPNIRQQAAINRMSIAHPFCTRTTCSCAAVTLLVFIFEASLI